MGKTFWKGQTDFVSFNCYRGGVQASRKQKNAKNLNTKSLRIQILRVYKLPQDVIQTTEGRKDLEYIKWVYSRFFTTLVRYAHRDYPLTSTLRYGQNDN